MWTEEQLSIEVLGRTQHKGAWEDVMNKAKRLIADGQVYPEEKRLHDLEDPSGPLYIEGTVVGDHSTYKSQIWTTNSDPRSLAVRSWACQCTWNRYVWNRTRQWRKYEGRICSHVLALYWQSKSLNLDEYSQAAIDEYQGKEIPNQPRLPGMEDIQQQPIVPKPRDTDRGAPAIFDYEQVMNPNINMTLDGMEEIPIIPPDEREDLLRDRVQPAQQALRPLDLDEQNAIREMEDRVRLEQLKERNKQVTPGFGKVDEKGVYRPTEIRKGPGGRFVKNDKASSITFLTISSNEQIKDLAKFIQISLLENRPVFARTTKEFWGERKNGLHPHPDARPIDHMEDGNFLYLPEDLGWDPENFQMGSDKVERGTYGSIPEGAQVQIVSVRSKDKLVLASYKIGNEFPNHDEIEVWIPIKDIYLIQWGGETDDR